MARWVLVCALHSVESPETPGRFKVTLRYGGTLYSIGIGRAHNGRAVVMLIHDTDITISEATTGEILRHLTLDTTRRYQPQNTKQGEP